MLKSGSGLRGVYQVGPPVRLWPTRWQAPDKSGGQFALHGQTMQKPQNSARFDSSAALRRWPRWLVLPACRVITGVSQDELRGSRHRLVEGAAAWDQLWEDKV